VALLAAGVCSVAVTWVLGLGVGAEAGRGRCCGPRPARTALLRVVEAVVRLLVRGDDVADAEAVELGRVGVPLLLDRPLDGPGRELLLDQGVDVGLRQVDALELLVGEQHRRVDVVRLEGLVVLLDQLLALLGARLGRHDGLEVLARGDHRATGGDLLPALALGLPGGGRDLHQQAVLVLEGHPDRPPRRLRGHDRVEDPVDPAHGGCRVLVRVRDRELPAADLLVVGHAGESLATGALQDPDQGVVVGAVVADDLLELPPEERPEDRRGGLALGEVGDVVLGERLRVDQALAVPLAERLDAGLVLLGAGGELDRPVAHDAVVVVLGLAAQGGDQVPRVGAEGVGAEAQRDLVRLAVAVGVLGREGDQRVVVLLDRGGHRQAEGVQPRRVDEQEVRVRQDAQLLDRRQRVDVPVGGGDRRADVRALLEDRAQDRRVLVDEVLQRHQRAVAAVLHDLGVREAGVVQHVGQVTRSQHEVLLLEVDLLGQVLPLDGDVGVLLPLLDQLHGVVVRGECRLGAAGREGQRLVDDREPLGLEPEVGGGVLRLARVPAATAARGQREGGDGQDRGHDKTTVSHRDSLLW
jgi:hypothetical protein